MKTMKPLASVLPVIVVASFLPGCGGGDGSGPDMFGPAGSAFTSLSVTITDTTLFTRPPGNTAIVTAKPLDRDGREMTGLGTPTFASDNEAVASVDAEGVVAAVSVGSTSIRASLTAHGVTRMASVGVAVTEGDLEARISAPGFAFIPGSVDIARGGTVTWTTSSIPHNVIFTTAGAPDDMPVALANTSRSRMFPESGTFQYVCTRHEGMSGAVVVH